jgi:YfiH family protein
MRAVTAKGMTRGATKSMSSDWIIPEWPAPARVRSLLTTRRGGVSRGAYASLNLGDHVGDDPRAVAENRRLLTRLAPPPLWLNQVHGIRVLDAAQVFAPLGMEADASFSRKPGVSCAVMTADCLPVLLCDQSGTVVAAAHAGWRGLHAGILEHTVAAMSCSGAGLLAYLGPAIGPQSFEVGDEVRTAFIDIDQAAEIAFKPHGVKWLADIYLLARQRLARLGVNNVFGGGGCTVEEPERFFSYRRDGVTGRMASMIWLEA